MPNGMTDECIQLLLEHKTEINLVWENPSPEEQFGAKTTLLDKASSATFFMMIDATGGFYFLKNNEETRLYSVAAYPNQRTITIAKKAFTTSIGEALSNGWQTNNGMIVPNRIFEVKNVG